MVIKFPYVLFEFVKRFLLCGYMEHSIQTYINMHVHTASLRGSLRLMGLMFDTGSGGPMRFRLELTAPLSCLMNKQPGLRVTCSNDHLAATFIPY